MTRDLTSPAAAANAADADADAASTAIGAIAAPGADIVVIVAHPQLEHSRVNRRLMRAAGRLPASADSPVIVVRDLYALYPDYFIDIEAEQALIAPAKLIVWQHPIHWYGMPPLMKLWLDDVLAFGWAYGPGGTVLRGKDLWLVATTGGPQESYHPHSYNRYHFDDFLPPYEQTATLCGLRFLPPLVLHGAHRIEEAEVQAHTDVYTQRLQTYPRWPEIDAVLYGLPGPVPEDARPDDEEPWANAAGRAPGRLKPARDRLGGSDDVPIDRGATSGPSAGPPQAGPHPRGGSVEVPVDRGAP